jgi:hypothetical protein
LIHTRSLKFLTPHRRAMPAPQARSPHEAYAWRAVPIAANGEPICPATKAARTAGAGQVREIGPMTQSRNHAKAALSD